MFIRGLQERLETILGRITIIISDRVQESNENGWAGRKCLTLENF